MLRSGIPNKHEYARLESEPLFEELLKFSRDFGQRCAAQSGSIRRYSNKWVQDPFLQWSRRWEYLYAAQRLATWAADRGGDAKIIDAGSGFTFFPFYLLQAHPNFRIDCFDTDPTVGQALAEASEVYSIKPGFQIENLEGLRLEDNAVDAVYSISVIEHTDNPQKVIDEVRRVLKPGGLFVCTFDISFEKRSPMHIRHVQHLVSHLEARFDAQADWQPLELETTADSSDIVTTDWIAESQKSTLPWRRPLLVWAYDLLRGRPRSKLYRPMTFCCATFTKPRSSSD